GYWWRRNRKIVFILGLATWFVLTTLATYVILATKINIPPQRFEKLRFSLQQNGRYWIYHDFVLAKTYRSQPSHGVTLTCHGTYQSFKDLDQLVVRWRAPISMALYVFQDEFEEVVASVQHLRYCSLARDDFVRWVSVQLVFHNDRKPTNVRKLDAHRPPQFRCDAPNATHKNHTYRLYPIPLLKNVARQNSRTFYVFPLEMDLLPSPNFERNFMRFVERRVLRQPRTSVFCVPIIPATKDYIGPIRYPISQNSNQLHSPKEDKVTEYSVDKEPMDCLVRVSINDYEPYDDQRCSDCSKLPVLVGLDYDFVHLKGAFVVRRHSGLRELSADTNLPPAKSNQVRDSIKLNSLV
ncbi:hypothetical protein KR018_000909, partial [Drosophila ironensis]